MTRARWADLVDSDSEPEATPTAQAMHAYFAGEGRRQVGSSVDECTGVVWLRPFRRPRWYVDRCVQTPNMQIVHLKQKPPAAPAAAAPRRQKIWRPVNHGALRRHQD